VFEGFSLSQIATADVSLRVRHGGSGPPLLLLHGFPQTHAMWSRVATRLAQRFTIIAPDLRGYGGSSKPETTADHGPYSKRAMARDQIALMRHFGFDRFAVAGHDRGGRCAYRLAIDFPDAVTKLAVLDIVPTSEALRRTDMSFAMGYWHWFFLSQPAPLPERMLGTDAANFPLLRQRELFEPEALADYTASFSAATIHAMCEDYRAGVGLDFTHDEEDRGRQRIRCPVLALWGARGAVGRWYDVLAVWREWASDVSGHAIDAGHFLAEEAPGPTGDALEKFFG
jgi:haloacetate dehalogenase